MVNNKRERRGTESGENTICSDVCVGTGSPHFFETLAHRGSQCSWNAIAFRQLVSQFLFGSEDLKRDRSLTVPLVRVPLPIAFPGSGKVLAIKSIGKNYFA